MSPPTTVTSQSVSQRAVRPASCLASAAVNFLPPPVVAPLPLVVEAVDAFLVVFLGGMGSRDMRKESL